MAGQAILECRAASSYLGCGSRSHTIWLFMSQWLVAIVGRPNVGKSTLFNRIIGHRDAIVHDTPGVTRDRHYAEAEWAGKSFSLVDTGGYVPASEDVIETAIREQAEVAIHEADVVLFVVDGESGPLSTEFESEKSR